MHLLFICKQIRNPAPHPAFIKGNILVNCIPLKQKNSDCQISYLSQLSFSFT